LEFFLGDGLSGFGLDGAFGLIIVLLFHSLTTSGGFRRFLDWRGIPVLASFRFDFSQFAVNSVLESSASNHLVLEPSLELLFSTALIKLVFVLILGDLSFNESSRVSPELFERLFRLRRPKPIINFSGLTSTFGVGSLRCDIFLSLSGWSLRALGSAADAEGSLFLLGLLLIVF